VKTIDNVDLRQVIEVLYVIGTGEPVEEKFLPRPMVSMPDLFTRAEITKARSLLTKHKGEAHTYILTEVVQPRMAHINEVTGQENDDRYLAYAVVYFLERHPKIGIPFNHDWNWVKSS
jgi:hypothetical protein